MTDTLEMLAPECPGEAFAEFLRRVRISAVDVENARLGHPLSRGIWERQKAYWNALTTMHACLDRIDAFLVRGFNEPKDQHPSKYAPGIRAERTKSLKGILAGEREQQLLLGNKTVLVKFTLTDPVAFDIGRSCPLQTQYRVRTINARAQKIIDEQRRKT